MSVALIGFAFDGEPQNVDRFREEPYWRDRFGEVPNAFGWTEFYEAFANRLLVFRNDRPGLLERIMRAAERVGGVNFSGDRYANGETGPLRDVCPFTVFGAFNRGIRDATRTSIAEAFARELEIAVPAPTSFSGVPTVNNQSSWFFRYEKDREAGDIDALWDVFEAALSIGEETEEAGDAFVRAFDAATELPLVKWKLTMGLFWVRPREFATMESGSRAYVEGKLGLPVKVGLQKGVIEGTDYLDLISDLEERFLLQGCPVHSFPELSLAAWQPEKPVAVRDDVDSQTHEMEPEPSPPAPYGVDDLLAEGCFLEPDRVHAVLARLRQKKNLVLQGPPGTGKTWLARRLAYALMGERAAERVAAIQFHPNLSYEDFVRGWRPQSSGGLTLVDGPLLEIAQWAQNSPEKSFVLVIEEINRGNPAQIFGEALTLLEADKRHLGEALRLCYPKNGGERVFLPPNLYLVGTMNVADRSLALVDLALRRRFAFVDLEPSLGARWRDWLSLAHGIPASALDLIQARVEALNLAIADDPALGSQFRVGHSYVTPHTGIELGDPLAWFRSVVETEIRPLLEEYWFDDPAKAREETARLLAGS